MSDLRQLALENGIESREKSQGEIISGLLRGGGKDDENDATTFTASGPFRIGVNVYKMETIDDLLNIPESIYDALVVAPYLLRNGDYERLIKMLTDYQNNVFGVDESESDLIRSLDKYPPDWWKIYNLHEEQARKFFDAAGRSRYGFEHKPTRTQLSKIDWRWPNEYTCDKSWVIVATINNQPYGAIFAFFDDKYPDTLKMQAIAKFAIPFKASFSENNIIKKLSPKLPKLNSILIPAVEKLGKDLGLKQIVVTPINKQTHILEDHYGFVKDKDAFKYFRCATGNRDQYVKYLNPINE